MVRQINNKQEETLDPDDWPMAQAIAHEIVDDAVLHLSNVREPPVWQEMPDSVRAACLTSPPENPMSLQDVYRGMTKNLLPYAMGKIHPRFWSWYMGSSNFTGALADFIAAIAGSNLGGENTTAAQLGLPDNLYQTL